MEEKDLKRSPAVKRWFRKKEPPYTQSTKNGYLNHMKMFCDILEMTPDEIVESIKTAEDPIREMDRIYKAILSYLIEARLKVRTVDQRTNCFNSFLHYNGIRLTPELKKHIKFLRKGLFKRSGIVVRLRKAERIGR